MAIDRRQHLAMRGDGLVAFDDGGDYLMASNPRGGCGLIWSMAERAVTRSVAMPDMCAVEALGPGQLVASSGNAGMKSFPADPAEPAANSGGAGSIWDNHMAAIVPA